MAYRIRGCGSTSARRRPFQWWKRCWPMGDRTRPALFNIPAHRAFSDALVTGVLAQHGDDPMRLAQGMILLPNNRAIRSVSDAFVRKSGGGLLLPRLVALGDPDLGEQVGGALDRSEAHTSELQSLMRI